MVFFKIKENYKMRGMARNGVYSGLKNFLALCFRNRFCWLFYDMVANSLHTDL